ncbi:MAG: hypothetical protein AAB538_02880, partial [Patescibacteria group bacterium]
MRFLCVLAAAVLVSLTPSAGTVAQAQLPSLLPSRIESDVTMEITRVHPGRWPLLPWRRAWMERQGWKPQSWHGPTRIIKIRVLIQPVPGQKFKQ